MADVRAESTRCLLPVIDEEAASLILDHLVRAEVRSSEIISVVLEWLRKHHSDPGYTRLLRALYKHPAVWECLLATRRLDKRVIADFRDYAMHHD
jgi:hypothetical protein